MKEIAEVMRDRALDYAGAIDALTDEAGGRLVTTEFAKDLRDIDTPAALGALVDDARFYLTGSFGFLGSVFGFLRGCAIVLLLRHVPTCLVVVLGSLANDLRIPDRETRSTL